MSDKSCESTDGVPAPVGPYSVAVQAGDLLFISGQIALDPTNDRLVEGGAEAEARMIMHNLEAILRSNGLGFRHLVKTTLFLTDLADYEAVNEVYGSVISPPYPARSAVQVAGLPKGARVELEAIAHIE